MSDLPEFHYLRYQNHVYLENNLKNTVQLNTNFFVLKVKKIKTRILIEFVTRNHSVSSNQVIVIHFKLKLV